jgi:hypothetical protein
MLLAATLGCNDPGNSAETRPGEPGLLVVDSASGGRLFGRIPCDPCEIVLEPLIVVSDSGAQVDFGEHQWFRRDRFGRVHATTLLRDQLAVFDSLGRLVRMLGRRGTGPGEFASAVFPALMDPTDSLWAMDPRLNQVNIYSSELDFVRSFPFRFWPDFFLPDGSVVSVRTVEDAELIGYAAHRVSREGHVLTSFGRDPPSYRPDQALLLEKIGVPTRDGLVWMTAIGRYELELWDPVSGRLLRTFTPDAPWFIETTGNFGDYRTRKPTGAVTSLWADTIGVVWVLSQIADQDWEPCCDGGPAPHEPATDESMSRYNDWVLNAIHPETGRVLAEKRFRNHVWATRGDGTIATMSTPRAAGTVSFRLSRPILTPSTRQGGIP